MKEIFNFERLWQNWWEKLLKIKNEDNVVLVSLMLTVNIGAIQLLVNNR